MGFLAQRTMMILLLCQMIFSAGIFPIVNIEPSLNQVDFLIGVRAAPEATSVCVGVNGSNSTCAHHFDLVLPQWFSEEQRTFYAPSKFILMNPNTHADTECSPISAGTDLNAVMRVQRNDGQLDLTVIKPNETVFVNTGIDYANVTGLNCFRYQFQVYNPEIVEKNETWKYPFDTYRARFGFEFPDAPAFQGVISVPEEFSIKSASVNSTIDRKKIEPTGNIVYFNIPTRENEATVFDIYFERSPEWSGAWIVSMAVVVLLPVLLFVSFLVPKKVKSFEMMVVIIPAFISFIPILLKHPNTKITIFDISITISISLLILKLAIGDWVGNAFERHIGEKVGGGLAILRWKVKRFWSF